MLMRSMVFASMSAEETAIAFAWISSKSSYSTLGESFLESLSFGR